MQHVYGIESHTYCWPIPGINLWSRYCSLLCFAHIWKNARSICPLSIVAVWLFAIWQPFLFSFCYIHVNRSSKICIRNLKFYTNVHLCIMHITWTILTLFEVKFYMHSHLWFMDVQINHFGNNLSIIHLTTRISG